MVSLDFSIQMPPFQQLMQYVFTAYSTLSPPCGIDCSDCKKYCPDCHIARYQGWRGGTPRYICQNIKQVYLQRNLAAHVAQTKSVLNKTIFIEHPSVQQITAASLGGGPGIEYLALADILQEKGCNWLYFRNYDVQNSWLDYFTDLSTNFAERLPTLKIDSAFVQRDILRHTANESYNLVFIPWVLSEVGAEQIQQFVYSAATACGPNGYVIVLERRETNLGGTIIEAFRNSGVFNRVFAEEDEVTGHCGINFPPEISEKFKPKFKFQSSYYIFQRS